ncbi:MAG: hypothetical protein CK425_04380 [Parachlamydia sp.]|nr:MAG: hypothetical protein CK425_04380 [Parachlamydia sp.]
MKQFKSFLFFLFISNACFFHLTLAAQSIVRAAIDFGSGAVKMQVGMVDIENNCIHGTPLLTKQISLGLTEDVAAHAGYISAEMEQKALDVLRDFKGAALVAAAREGQPLVHFTAIATAVFRAASNGKDLLNKIEQQLGIRFQILPQEEEGKLGFLTAAALFADTPEAALVAWDSGNGSFQITAREEGQYVVYQGPLGHGTVRTVLSKDIRNGPILQTYESGNPVLPTEAVELIQKIHGFLPPIPKWLHARLRTEKTVIATFGGGESIFALVAYALAGLKGAKEVGKQTVISVLDVQRVIEIYLEQRDEVFDAAGVHRKTLTSAVYLATLMEYFGIDKIHFKESIGNAPGMLVDPQLWKEGVSTTFPAREPEFCINEEAFLLLQQTDRHPPRPLLSLFPRI